MIRSLTNSGVPCGVLCSIEDGPTLVAFAGGLGLDLEFYRHVVEGFPRLFIHRGELHTV